jgi:hypothetical protein
VLKGLELNRYYHVREGDLQALPMDLKRIHFDLKGGNAQPAHQMKMAMPAGP